MIPTRWDPEVRDAEIPLPGLLHFYYAFGDTDVFAIVEVPDHAAATAASLAVTASGAATVRTVVLMTPEEMDQATRKVVSYRPPAH